MTIRRIGKAYASVNGSCLFSIGSDGNGKDNKYCCGRKLTKMAADVKKQVTSPTMTGEPSSPKAAIKGSVQLPPLRDCVQRVVLYETGQRFFLVGSNNWILKIDRKNSLHMVQQSSSGSSSISQSQPRRGKFKRSKKR